MVAAAIAAFGYESLEWTAAAGGFANLVDGLAAEEKEELCPHHHRRRCAGSQLGLDRRLVR